MAPPPPLKRLADLLGKAVTVTAFAAMLPGSCRYRREPEAAERRKQRDPIPLQLIQGRIVRLPP